MERRDRGDATPHSLPTSEALETSPTATVAPAVSVRPHAADGPPSALDATLAHVDVPVSLRYRSEDGHDDFPLGLRGPPSCEGARPRVPNDPLAAVGLSVGTLVDRTYRVERALGVGGMGVVALAVDE